MGLLFLLPEAFILQPFMLVKIALIEASGTRPVVFPIAQAYPAKMKLAGRADHMITALILFDVRVAIWTFLGVGLKPDLICVVLDFS